MVSNNITSAGFNSGITYRFLFLFSSNKLLLIFFLQFLLLLLNNFILNGIKYFVDARPMHLTSDVEPLPDVLLFLEDDPPLLSSFFVFPPPGNKMQFNQVYFYSD